MAVSSTVKRFWLSDNLSCTFFLVALKLTLELMFQSKKGNLKGIFEKNEGEWKGKKILFDIFDIYIYIY